MESVCRMPDECGKSSQAIWRCGRSVAAGATKFSVLLGGRVPMRHQLTYRTLSCTALLVDSTIVDGVKNYTENIKIALTVKYRP